MDEIREWVKKLDAEAEAEWKAKIEQEAAREKDLCRGWVQRVHDWFAHTSEGQMILNAFPHREIVGKGLLFESVNTRIYFDHRNWEEVKCDVTVERSFIVESGLMPSAQDVTTITFLWPADMEQLARQLVELDRRAAGIRNSRLRANAQHVCEAVLAQNIDEDTRVSQIKTLLARAYPCEYDVISQALGDWAPDLE